MTLTRDRMPQEAIARVLKAGYRVWMRRANDSWLFFTDEQNRIGNLGHDYWRGYSLTTVHIPNHQTGTGFAIADGLLLESLTKETLSAAFEHSPHWATSGDRASVRKFRVFEAFRSSCRFNSDYSEVTESEVGA